MSRIVLSLALAALTLALTPAPSVGRADSRRADRALDSALSELVRTRSGPPGAIAVVQRGASRRSHFAGVAVVGTHKRPRVSDLMRIASVSKAFSGASALSLVAAGRLRLDDTIGKLLPDLPAAWAPVTLAQALHHTSGLPDFTAADGFRKAFVAAPHATPQPRELLSFAAGEPLQFAPGSRFSYSNTDNVVVALMTSAATGSPYAAVLRSQVARPLRLRRTSLPTGFRLPAPAIHGYDTSDAKPDDVTTLSSASWAFASGGIVSTPADLNTFVRGYVGRRLFGRALQRRQLALVPGSSEPPGPGRNSAGLGIFRYRTRCGTVYGHTGNIFGYTQFIAASLDGRRSATVSASGQFSQNRSAKVFKKLRGVFGRAVCAATARP